MTYVKKRFPEKGLRGLSVPSNELSELLRTAPYFGQVKELIENAPSRFGSALDLGCGSVIRDLRLLRSLGVGTLVGIDMGPKPDPAVMEDTISYITADLEGRSLPAADSSFDLVIMDNVIEHMYNPRSVLEECMRVLKPSGVLAVMTPNQARLTNRLRLLMGRSVYYPLDFWLGIREEHVERRHRKVFAGHIREYTIPELKTMLGLVGFVVEAVKLYSAAVPSSRQGMSKSRFLLRSYNVVERAIPDAGYMISMLARKP